MTVKITVANTHDEEEKIIPPQFHTSKPTQQKRATTPPT